MALQGTLDTFALPDVLRLLAATTKTGRLQIQGNRGAGEVWIDQGLVVGGAVDARTEDSSDVVFELLRHEQGSFEFVAGEPDPDAHDPIDVEEVISGAEVKLSEWRDVEAVVPSLGCWIALVDELPHDEVVVTRDRWNLLIAIGEGRSVADLDTRLDLGEIKVSKAVKTLADDGIIVVGEAPSTEAPAEVEAEEHAPEDDDAPIADVHVEDVFDPNALQIDDTFGLDEVSARDELAAQLADLAGLDEHGELPVDDFDPDGIVLGLDAEDHGRDLEPLPADDQATDLDEAVRAEIDSDGEGNDDGLGGSREVDLDTSLDAVAGDHSYISADDAADGSALPEPLPVTDADLLPADADPFAHTPVADHEAADFDPAAIDGSDAADSAEVARHLAQLSPKAARAIAAAADGGDGKKKATKTAKPEEPMNRNLLMKFISSK